MAAPQQGNQGDNAYSMIWGVAALFAVLGIAWYVFKDYIVTSYLLLKLYEVKFLSLFAEQYVSQLQSIILSALANSKSATFDEILQIGTSVGNWLRFPILILLFALGFVVYIGNTARVYRRTYSMQDLAKLEKVNWPQISPVIDMNLIKTDIDTGPWAMAMTPMQFCKKHKLLDEIRQQRRQGVSRRSQSQIEVALKRGEANKLFALQLNQLWKSPEKLPPHTRALFAVFAARINADSKGAANVLAQLSASSTAKLNMTGVSELLKKHTDIKLVQQIMQSHAYVLTVMASMLEGARTDGVQASSDFLWLKPIDRRLWYTLNTVGRQTPFVEVAGVFAHWVAEKEAGRKLLVPMVEEATNALETALKEVVYHPDEEA